MIDAGVTYMRPRLSLEAMVGLDDAVEMIAYFRRRVAEGIERFCCQPELMWSETLAAVGRGGNEMQILAVTSAAQEAIDAGEISARSLSGLRVESGGNE